MRTAIHFLLLAQTWGAINLAINKPATQSGDFVHSSGFRLLASRAVDENTGTFSYTAVGRAVNWWRVDLGAKYTFGRIRIYNRGGSYNGQLSRTSILTSNATSPSTPSLASNDWTRVTYREPAYGNIGTHSFNPPIDGQYVAVYNEESGGMALTEVEVYDYNYARSKPTGSSSNTAASYKAVDGDLSTVFSTSNEQSPWWKVDLGEAILLREVMLFVKVETQLTDVTLLTNPSNTATEPNTAGYDGWNKCRYSEQALDEFQTVQCNQGYQYPLTRLFSIRSSAVTRIQLRQVEVYGFELPQLSGNIDGKAVTATSTSITVSFLPWNQLMNGGSPPTGCHVTMANNSSSTKPYLYAPTKDGKRINWELGKPPQDSTTGTAGDTAIARSNLSSSSAAEGSNTTTSSSATSSTERPVRLAAIEPGELFRKWQLQRTIPEGQANEDYSPDGADQHPDVQPMHVAFQCRCGDRCHEMPTLLANKCCADEPLDSTHLPGHSEGQCLLENEELTHVISQINARCSWLREMRYHGHRGPALAFTNMTNRRSYIDYIYGKLGRWTRKVVPSCIVLEVRRH